LVITVTRPVGVVIGGLEGGGGSVVAGFVVAGDGALEVVVVEGGPVVGVEFESGWDAAQEATRTAAETATASLARTVTADLVAGAAGSGGDAPTG
jgi:hypothetical protein